MLVSWFFASIISNGLWFILAVAPGGIGAVSFGLSESLLTSMAVVVVGGIVYVVLGWLGSTLLPVLVDNRTLVMGVLGGLAGSLISIYRLPA
jgi:hypothetical protein